MSLFEELNDAEVPPIPVEIIPEVTGPPAFTLYVKQLPPQRVQSMRDKSTAKVGGQRQDQASIARRRHAFLTEFLDEALEKRWDNATEPNLSALLRRARAKLGKSAVDAIEKNGGTLPFSVESAVMLVKITQDEDMDGPIWQAARYGAEQEAKAQGEGGSGSGAPA